MQYDVYTNRARPRFAVFLWLYQCVGVSQLTFFRVQTHTAHTQCSYMHDVQQVVSNAIRFIVYFAARFVYRIVVRRTDGRTTAAIYVWCRCSSNAMRYLKRCTSRMDALAHLQTKTTTYCWVNIIDVSLFGITLSQTLVCIHAVCKSYENEKSTNNLIDAYKRNHHMVSVVCVIWTYIHLILNIMCSKDTFAGKCNVSSLEMCLTHTHSL